jgi:hypothetical protein
MKSVAAPMTPTHPPRQNDIPQHPRPFEMTDASTDDLPAVTCPDCGKELRGPLLTRANKDYNPKGPLWKDTPFERLSAIARDARIHLVDIPEADTDGLAGAIATGHYPTGELRAIIFLAEDLDHDTRTDVLAFAIAVFVGEPNRITSQPKGYIGITRDRLPPATKGAAHLAWHMLWTCGRRSPSATFKLTRM